MRISNKFTEISFKGRIQFYSDFDGTYCPEKHSAMHNPVSNKNMQEYCRKMDIFFNTLKNDLSFHITTGRTFGEFEAVSWLLKMRNYRLPLPDSVITKNGSDEFLKIGSDNDFYERNIFPFNKKNTSAKKENKIKKITNWDGKKIKTYIKEAAQNVYLNFIEAESEHSVKDYGNMSLYSSGKLNPDEWTKLPQKGFQLLTHKNPIADFSIGSRDDGKLKVNLIFPPDYDYCPFRTWVYDNFVDDIKKYLKNNNVKYFESWEMPNYMNHYRKSLTITPKINNKELTKIFDTREAVKSAIKNNDLVIVAGDGSNDFEMLNPLEYISDKEWKKYAKNSNFPEFYYGDMKKKLRDLKNVYNGNVSEYIDELRQELVQNGFLENLAKLPFMGIVVRKENSELQKLVDTFSNSGKIIEVEKSNLEKGIINAVKEYATHNKAFKNTMSDNLKKIVYEKT